MIRGQGEDHNPKKSHLIKKETSGPGKEHERRSTRFDIWMRIGFLWHIIRAKDAEVAFLVGAFGRLFRKGKSRDLPGPLTLVPYKRQGPGGDSVRWAWRWNWKRRLGRRCVVLARYQCTFPSYTDWFVDLDQGHITGLICPCLDSGT